MDKIASLKSDLEQIDTELESNRQAMTRDVMKNPDAAQATAARLIVLEARRAAVVELIEQAERTEANRAEFIGSREYRDAQKKIADLEKQFSQDAKQARAALYALRDMVMSALQKQPELNALVGKYCIELSPIQQNSRVMNTDIGFLMCLHSLIGGHIQRLELAERIGQPVRSQSGPAHAQKPI